MKDTIGSSSEIKLFHDCLNTQIPNLFPTIEKETISIIGSGLSFAAASFLSRFLDKYMISNRVYTPLEYCSINSKSIPILITYRGKNRDIESVSKHIVKNQITKCIIFSGFKVCPIEKYLQNNNVSVYKIVLPEHKEENRFVSFKATVSMISTSYIFSMSLLNQNEQMPNIEEISNIFNQSVNKATILADNICCDNNWQFKKWIVVGKGFLDPFSVLIQSVFAESGLLSIQIADYKDYTHGKYLAAFQEKSNSFFLLDYSDNKNVFNIMKSRFSNFFDVNTIPVSINDFYNCLEGIISIFHLASILSERKNYSLKSPPKPKEMRRWSSWGKIR